MADIVLVEPWRDLPAGDWMGKVFLNNVNKRVVSADRLEFAEALVRAMSSTLPAGAGITEGL